MDNRIEDKIFLKALEAQGIKRTKEMYEEAEYPHLCDMCQENSPLGGMTYRLKTKCIRDFLEPYIFICEDCYRELPSDTTESD